MINVLNDIMPEGGTNVILECDLLKNALKDDMRDGGDTRVVGAELQPDGRWASGVPTARLVTGDSRVGLWCSSAGNATGEVELSTFSRLSSACGHDTGLVESTVGVSCSPKAPSGSV